MTPTVAERIEAVDLLVRDPICGMAFRPDEAVATRTVNGRMRYFCSERCVRQFDHDAAVAAREGRATQPPAWHAVSAPATDVAPDRVASSTHGSTHGNASGRGHWLMLALCVAPLAVFAAVAWFGVPLSNVLLYGVILLCPLSHLLMMRGHGDGHGGLAAGAGRGHQAGASTSASTGATTGATTSGRSCH